MSYPTTQPIPSNVIKTLRYLIGVTVNSSFVRLKQDSSIDFVYMVGTIISENLPTRYSRHWKKNILQFKGDQKKGVLMSQLWPIDASIIFYPSKVIYTEGDIIFFELKLFGADAEHDFFLETILPAIEDIGYKKDRDWYKSSTLWGHYDVSYICIADGFNWIPLAEDGVINLKYNPNPWQWLNVDTHEKFKLMMSHKYRAVEWLKGVTLSDDLQTDNIDENYRSLYFLMSSILERMNYLLEVSNRSKLTIFDLMDNNEQKENFEIALEDSKKVLFGRHDLSISHSKSAGRWFGTQKFNQDIQSIFIPYLNLGSVFHIGDNINYGAGTFSLSMI